MSAVDRVGHPSGSLGINRWCTSEPEILVPLPLSGTPETRGGSLSVKLVREAMIRGRDPVEGSSRTEN